jgi:hypothetical protein
VSETTTDWKATVHEALNALTSDDSDEDAHTLISEAEEAAPRTKEAGPKDYVQRARSALESERETDTRAVRFLEASLREA